MEHSSKQSQTEKPKDAPSSPRRIQTQIHRRKKAKAASPLMNEWEDSQSLPPKGLKRSPEDMHQG